MTERKIFAERPYWVETVVWGDRPFQIEHEVDLLHMLFVSADGPALESTTERFRYSLADRYDALGRPFSIALVGNDFAYDNGWFVSGEITAMELYGSDGSTLIERIDFSTPISDNLECFGVSALLQPDDTTGWLLSFERYGIASRAYTSGYLIVRGGPGDDRLYGDGGPQTLLGGDGDDSLSMRNADWWFEAGPTFTNVVLDGGNGYDYVSLDFARATSALHLSLDSIQFGGGVELSDGIVIRNVERAYIYLGACDDFIEAADIEISVIAGAGRDTVFGSSANDWIDGEAGDDFIFGGAGDDILKHNDTRYSDYGQPLTGPSADTIDGGDGNDWLIIDHYTLPEGLRIDLRQAHTNEGALQLSGALFRNIEHATITTQRDGDGSAANDRVIGTIGSDGIMTGPGDDVLDGYDGDDRLDGGSGSDTIDGGAGNDIVTIDAEDDIRNIRGGEGFDTLMMSRMLPPDDLDLITMGFESARVELIDEGDEWWSYQVFELDAHLNVLTLSIVADDGRSFVPTVDDFAGGYGINWASITGVATPRWVANDQTGQSGYELRVFTNSYSCDVGPSQDIGLLVDSPHFLPPEAGSGWG